MAKLDIVLLGDARLRRKSKPIRKFNADLQQLAADEAEILMVAVAPAEQGRGLGRRLIARHLSRLAARGVRRVFLEVDEGNEPALRLYTRAGFMQVGRRPGYYAKDEGHAAALILRRNLD